MIRHAAATATATSPKALRGTAGQGEGVAVVVDETGGAAVQYTFGEYVLDTQRYELRRSGTPIKLRRKVYQVLEYLLAHAERVVTKQELLDHLWPEQFVGDEALKSCIKTLRQTLGERGRTSRFVRTVHGQGYRVVTPVVTHTPRPAEGSVLAASAAVLPGEVSLVFGTEQAEAAPVPADTASPSADGLMSPIPEHRQLTLLSCTLSTATHHRLLQLEPDDLHEAMHAFHALCTTLIQTYGGSMAQRFDEGVVAYFGYPQAQEDAARRAVLTGVRLVEAAATRLTTRGAQLASDCAVQIGIHTGMVVMIPLDDGEVTRAIAVGPACGIASGLRELAAPQTVLISAATARLVEGYFLWQELTPYTPPGQTDALRVYQVSGPSQAQIRLDLVPVERLTPFVGRESELRWLDERWTLAHAGRGQVVVLRGEAGIGKSRLVRMVAERLASTSCRYLEGRGSPYYHQTAFYAVSEWLRHLIHSEAPMATDAPRQALADVSTQYGFEASESVPLLAPLLHLAVPDDHERLRHLTSQQQRQRLLALLVSVMVQLTEDAPVLLVLEDVHWVDPSTLEWVEMVLDQIPTRRLLLLVTCRPEFEAPWGSRSYLTQIALDRLTPEQSRQMVAWVASETPLSADVQRQIVAQTDGVPLFIEEFTRAVLSTGSSGSIPATLQDALMARLDQMGPAKGTAQLGAVLGRQFPHGVLQAISSKYPTDLADDLRRLVAAELVYQRGLGDATTYVFKHALIQDAAYASLLRSTRQQVHQRIAQVLEEQFPETVETQPEVLAHHYTEAGEHAQALDYWQQAGDKAMARSAFREAVACFEQALVAVPHLPEQRDTLAQAIDLRIVLDTALLASGEPRRGFEHLREAERLAESLGDQRRLGRICAAMIHPFWRTGDYDQALAYGQRALDLTAASGNVFEQASAHGFLGTVYFTLGDYRRAMDMLRRSIAALEGKLLHARPGVMVISVRSRDWLIACLGELGEFAEGLACGEEAARIAEATSHLSSAIFTQYRLGHLLLRQGNHQRASPVLERALAHCRTANIPVFLSGIAATLGLAYVLSGQVDEALALLEQAVEQQNASAQRGGSTELLILGEAYLLADRRVDAVQLAERLLALSRDRKECGHQAWALRLLGEIAMHRNPPDLEQAKTHYQQALTLANELGMRPLQAHCRRGLGTLYGQTGRSEQARAELSAAIEMYRAMEMTFWLPQAEAALAEIDGRS